MIEHLAEHSRFEFPSAHRTDLRLFHLVTRTTPMLHRLSAWVAAQTPEDAICIWESTGLAQHEPISVFEYDMGAPGLVTLESESCRVAALSGPLPTARISEAQAA